MAQAPYTKASPVEVRKADGTVEEHTAYSVGEFRAITANKHRRKVERAKQRRNQ